MIIIKSISFEKGNHVNKVHFLPTWLRGSVSVDYLWLDSLIKIEDGEEVEVGDTEFIGWWSYNNLTPLQSLAHHILMVFDAYGVGYPLDNPQYRNQFNTSSLISSREDERGNDNSFQAWCKIYDKKGFNKKKSYTEWQNYYETNIYAFRKVSQLTYTIYQLFGFSSWEDMYNWSLDVYNKVINVE